MLDTHSQASILLVDDIPANLQALEALLAPFGHPGAEVHPPRDTDLLARGAGPGHYGLGVNAYGVKPVAFPDFVAALKELGFFWAVVNVPPPGSLTRRGEN